MLRIHLFGQFRLFDGEQPLKFAAPPKTLPLLVYLLLQRKTSISRDRLAFLLWPDEPEQQARGNVRRHLHHLQRALPPAPPDRPWLLTEAGELQWNPLGDWWLDVQEFERLAAGPDGLADAVSLYTDDLLTTLYDDWIIVERERLRGLLFAGLSQLVARHRERGNYAQAIGYARQVLARDPLHEETLRELIALLALSGERATALQVYQRFERRLNEELGVEPMPETAALYRAISRNEPLEGEAPARPAPPVVEAPRRASNLPTQLTAFVGRQAELAQVHQLVRPPDGLARLLTLTGPGGSGKTRLALEAATRWQTAEPGLFPDGLFFVNLADINDPALVAPAIAAQLGFQEAGQSPEAQLKQALRDRQTLMVLDNFEQVVEAGPLVAELLAAAPGLRVIVTSRAVLRLYGEVEFPVPPLPLPDPTRLPPVSELMNYAAIALFVERARAANRQFALTESNAAQVAEICARLDGLPLALELAAARSKMFTPAAMLGRLSSRLEFLTGQARSVAARQQTLRLAIDWSYNLLAPSEQALFARLGVLVGGFTLEAGAAVAHDGENLADLAGNSAFEDLLASLVDQSVLRPDTSGAGDGEPRFRMLLTLREYALNQLAARGELVDRQQRHAQYYLALAERAAPELLGPAQADWVNRLEADHDNLREALAWRLAHEPNGAHGMRQFAALGHFWYLRSHLAEGRRWLEQALERWPDAPAALRGEVGRACGVLALTQGDRAAAKALLQQALAAWAEAGPAHQRETARTLRNLGLVAWAQADLTLAQNYHERALELAYRAGDVQNLGNALNALGLIAFAHGNLAAATAHYEEGLAYARRAGDMLCIANTVNNLGLVALEQSNFEAARKHLAEALERFEQLGHRQGVAIALNNLGNAHRTHGDLAEAQSYFEQSIAADRDHGNEAHTAYPLFGLGAVACRRGDMAEARRYFARSLDVRQRYNDRRGVAQCLDGLAWVAAGLGQAARAAQLLGAAEALREALAEPLHPVDIHGEREAALARIHAALTPGELEAAWQAGKTLSVEAATTLALAAPDAPTPML